MKFYLKSFHRNVSAFIVHLNTYNWRGKKGEIGLCRKSAKESTKNL